MGPPDSHGVPRAPRYSGCRYASIGFAYRTITFCGATFQTLPLASILPCPGPTTPVEPESHWFGLFPGRSPLLGESLLFSLPAGTKMFQFPAFASTIEVDDSPSDCRVAPFGNPGIKDRLRLPRAFRSLPRPSSPSRATGIRRAPFLAFACPTSKDAGRIPWNCSINFLSELGIYSVFSSVPTCQ